MLLSIRFCFSVVIYTTVVYIGANIYKGISYCIIRIEYTTAT